MNPERLAEMSREELLEYIRYLEVVADTWQGNFELVASVKTPSAPRKRRWFGV